MKELDFIQLKSVKGCRLEAAIKIAKEVGRAIRDSAAYEAGKAGAKKLAESHSSEAIAKAREGKTLTRRGYR